MISPSISQSFLDRVAIVTGGGTGIGQAVAVQLAAAGARVLIIGRRSQPLRETEELHPNIVGLVADVQSETDIIRAVSTAVERWGRLDMVVNNAGTFAARPIEALSATMIAQLFATNITGPSLLVKAALPHLEASQGSITNVSSTFGQKAASLIGHYAATKAALDHLTRCWALELAPRGIRVNAVAPGPTETPILEQAGFAPEALTELKRKEAEGIPLGRRGEPDEVAAWIVALANPGARWMTGQVLAIDGGLAVS